MNEETKAAVGTALGVSLQGWGLDPITTSMVVSFVNARVLPVLHDNLCQVFTKTSSYFRRGKKVPGSHDPVRFLEIMEGASRASTEPEQELWARLLAGELEAPGSSSKRLIGTMKRMDHNEAAIFMKAAPFVCLGGFLPRPKKQGSFPNDEERVLLYEAGLIENPRRSPDTYELKTPPGKVFTVPPLTLEVVKGMGNANRIKGEELTRMGKMLYNLALEGFAISVDGACELAQEWRFWMISRFPDGSILFDPSVTLSSDEATKFRQARVAAWRSMGSQP